MQRRAAKAAAAERPPPGPPETDIERQQEANIARNQALLVTLGSARAAPAQQARHP